MAGLISSLLIMLVMSFMMVAQFKAGATIMKVVWPTEAAAFFADEPASNTAANPSTAPSSEKAVADATTDAPKASAPAPAKLDKLYLVGLIVFSVTVVGYTMIGGFLAAVWTDLFQSVLMWIGIMILLAFTLYQVPDFQTATMGAVQNTGDAFAFGPGYAKDGREFLPVGLAVSFFFVWVFSGIASPAGVVRLMACKDTQTIRRSIFALAVYNMMIYIPLFVICIVARSLIPSLQASDEVVPRMALLTTKDTWGGPLIAGLVLVAPFGAVMATVSSYLVVIASGLVHDVYQRFLRPHAGQQEIRVVTYVAMAMVGVIAVVANIWPVDFLQVIVVFCGSTAASSFVVPTLMTAYWRRATTPGVIASMLAGVGTSLALLLLGSMTNDPLIGAPTKFRSYYLFGMEPIVWGLLASLVVGLLVTSITKPPDPELVSKLFDERPRPGERPA